jgi:hypothetical protein
VIWFIPQVRCSLSDKTFEYLWISGLMAELIVLQHPGVHSGEVFP